MKAFAGESQARNRYTYFASKAGNEGCGQLADFFTETANQEKEHAKRFFSFLEGGMLEITAIFTAGIVETTLENLLAAAGEHEEHTDLYPWRCRNCGYFHEGEEAPGECPACAHLQAHLNFLKKITNDISTPSALKGEGNST